MTGFGEVNLTNCDREPIHIPGSIQPHGALIACDPMATTILRHSANAAGMLGISPNLNGADLNDVLGPRVAHEIRSALTRARGGPKAASILACRLDNGVVVDMAVHLFKANAIIEFELAGDTINEPLELARTMITRIARINTIDRLVRETARLVRAALGYDRVMIYQFGHDEAGKVMSEARRPDLESFLGQYFPAADIPQQARALYLKNTIRVISDVNFSPVPVLPVLDASGEPLDLSYAHLRSVSPIHCEYLRNMGVGASMSVSIVVDGALWGLIACHHYDRRVLTLPQRIAVEMLGDFFSLHLNVLIHRETLETAQAARNALDRFLRDAAKADDINHALREALPDFSQLIPSDGVAMWLDGELTALGSTPPNDAILNIARFAETVVDNGVWATHKLSVALPEAIDYADRVAGLLVVPLSQRPRDYLLLFRKELVQTLKWAGNPDKTYETGPLGDRLTPRKSFDIWKETVRGQSAPWTAQERQFAEAARGALVEVILHNSELLADERARADVRLKVLNDELNHRVKNILAVIRSLVSQSAKDGDELEAYVAVLRGRIQALSLAHDQVVRGDGGGAIGSLLEAELAPYRDGSRTITVAGPVVWLDARAYSIMALVLHELSTNAAKYGALSVSGSQLSVTWRLDDAGSCHIAWVERGGPLVRPPNRQGFGSTLIDRSIPFDLGGESRIAYDPQGVSGAFRIPTRFVAPGPKESVSPQKNAPDPDAVPTSLSGRTVLVVEDQMLIALDLVEMLEDAGMIVFGPAASVQEALELLATAPPDIAILDVNLGDETSGTIARTLSAVGTPYLFSTGYDEKGGVLSDFPDVPIVRKPYDQRAMFGEIRKILARYAGNT